ncbi:DoxX family protein [Mucilaginibacter limnophilus]|uniref:DoxX family protein n=1 Tax=Mucilaginibacter limnophilus TaxID=1932778 RepID=A0A3S2Y1C7_9SPHI|nr:DoxX family protein [Mucilaginibacter limnophilus]RVU01198.1 DoxX family protein [Mucilaginibacter limnophilus]
MNKRNKIFYWIITIFLSIGMTAGGVQQLLQIGGYNNIVSSLGYPLYLLSIIGAWKILGVIAILVPGFRLLKEWAYAGYLFTMSGAFVSHLVIGQAFAEAVPSLVLLMATVLSWFFRPANRKLNLNNNTNEKSQSRMVLQ